MKEIRLETGENLQNKIERFIDQVCEEYKIDDNLYGNILMTAVEFTDIIMRIKKQVHLREISVESYREHDKLILEIYNQEKVDFRYHINEIQMSSKSDLLFLINKLADQVEYAVSGDLISFTYYLDIEKQMDMPNRRTLLKEYLSSSGKTIRV